MKSTYGQLKSVSLDTTQEGTLSIKIQKRLIKTVCFIALFCAVSYFNVKIAITLSIIAILVRAIIFIKEVLALNFNFTLDDMDLMEINEQMWR